jgi:glycosyltransferase involved in cell wall biosynthesis
MAVLEADDTQPRRKRWYLPRPPIFTFHQHAPRSVTYSRRKPPKTRASSPTIHIVTPSLNQGQFIRATIDSVLSQEYPNLHYRVQDGKSSDGTIEILNEYDSLSWKSETDSGQANAINRGFIGADCDIMAYLNSDDILLPGSLARVARFFEQHPEIDIVYGHRIFIDQDGQEIGRVVYPPHSAKALLYVGYVPQETMFWRKRVSDKIGLFDETFRYALDWDFLLRAQHAGFKFARLPRFIGCFRIHTSQKTTALLGTGKAEIDLLRKRHIGHAPAQWDILKAVLPYLAHQYLYQVMHRAVHQIIRKM